MIRFLSFLSLIFICSPLTVSSGQVTLFDAGTGTSFSDIGVNPFSREVVLIGQQDAGGSNIDTVYYLSADQTSFRTESIVGLGPNLSVSSLSPNGAWIAGTSDTTLAPEGEAIAWRSSAPDAPIAVGIVDDHPFGFDASAGGAAWDGGIIGTYNFDRGSEGGIFQWNPTDGLAPTSDGTAVDIEVFDVSRNGDVVGVEYNGSGNDPFPAYFDHSNSAFFAPLGYNLAEFDRPGPENSSGFDTRGEVSAVSPNGEFIAGGYLDISFSDVSLNGVNVFTRGEVGGYVQQLTVQQELDGALENLFGEVAGISDSGFTIINSDDMETLIWHSSFNGIDSEFLGAQLFDEWLLEVGDFALPSASTELVGIAEDGREIHFAVNSGDQAFVVSLVTVPEPGSTSVLLFMATAIFVQRRKRLRC